MATTVDHKLAEFAVKKTCEAVKHDKVLIFSDKKLSLPFSYNFSKITIPFGRKDWCYFITKELHKFVDTDHVLILQPDGFGVNGEYWTDDFFNYDFIAAPFSTKSKHIQESIKVCSPICPVPIDTTPRIINGAGGLSLRSKRLLEITSQDFLEMKLPRKYDFSKEGIFKDDQTAPEDLMVSLFHREFLEKEHNIKFASVETALRFSNEDVHTEGHSFGFHGWGYVPFYLNREECKFYMDNMKEITPKNVWNLNNLKLLSSLIRMQYVDLYNQFMSKMTKVIAASEKNA